MVNNPNVYMRRSLGNQRGLKLSRKFLESLFSLSWELGRDPSEVVRCLFRFSDVRCLAREKFEITFELLFLYTIIQVTELSLIGVVLLKVSLCFFCVRSLNKFGNTKKLNLVWNYFFFQSQRNQTEKTWKWFL